MSYQALVFCPDEKTARVVTQVLTELDFTVEPCNEPFAAVKKLMAQHFDAVVVDCENEQNATLLFKSARNSGSNQSSLAVAVVEGQAGVAKAFRIGANLVLTKPINVEQSKGTLRVARGLLRKAEASKPAAAASPSAEQPVRPAATMSEPTRPAVRATPAMKPAFPSFQAQETQPTPAVAMASASPFELEKEPEPQPEPAEVALLESMPDPLTTSNKPAAEPATNSSRSKEYPWQPVSKHSEPMASALRRAAEAAKPKERAAPTASTAPIPQAGAAGAKEVKEIRPAASGMASAQGAASAPAPARETLQPSVKPWEPMRRSATAPAPSKDEDKPQPLAKKASAVQEPAIEPPSFSALRLHDDEASEGGGSKKRLLMVAAVIIAVAASYFGWSKMHSGGTQPAVQRQAPAVQAPATPAAEPELQATTAAKPSPSEVKTAPARANDQVTPAPGAKASAASKTTITIGTPAAASKEVTVATVQAPLVVKNSMPKPAAAQPAPSETAEPPVMGAIGVASTDDKAISGIISTTTVNVPAKPPQTVRISQGVSQGLLLKRVQPTYPSQAIQMRVQGTVQLEASINKDGSITAVKVLSGDSALARAAVEAVRQWKYQPYYLNGEPVAIQTQITVNFKLP